MHWIVDNHHLSIQTVSFPSSRPGRAGGKIPSHRPTVICVFFCRKVPKTLLNNPKTGPSIMYFSPLMSDDLKSSFFMKKTSRDTRIFYRFVMIS